MTLWSRSAEWWSLIDRGEVIQRARDIGPSGGSLILSGSPGYGHVEAATLVATELQRFGWTCHEVSFDAEVDASEIIVRCLESLYPPLTGSVPQRAQVGGLSRSSLGRYFKQVTSAESGRHCLALLFPDRHGPMDPRELDYLGKLQSDDLSFLVISDGSSDWGADAGFEEVLLPGFLIEHLELFVQREPRLSAVDVDKVRAIFADLCASDGRLVPLATYTRVQSLAMRLGG